MNEQERLMKEFEKFYLKHMNDYPDDDSLIADFHKFLKDSNLVDNFVYSAKEKSYQELSKINSAKSNAEKDRIIQKALEIDPTNVDAEGMRIDRLKKVGDRLKALKILEEAERGRLKDYMKSDVGHFWGILETRPYIRVLNNLAKIYIDEQMYVVAAKWLREIIRLNKNDNTGARYSLMILHMRLGQEKEMRALKKKYGECSILMEMPLLLFLIQTERDLEAIQLYRELEEKFPGFNALILAKGIKFDVLNRVDWQGGYQPGTEEELAEFFINTYDLLGEFDGYAYQWLYSHKGKKRKTKP